MKIGILTFHNIPNIGAMLQAYALCKTLRNLGYSCDIIDYSCAPIIERELQFHSTHNIAKDCLLKLFVWPNKQKKIKQCSEWMNRAGIISPQKYNRENIKDSVAEYDVFISGSDMIWNLEITKHDYTFFQDFVTSDKKQISYASSIGGTWKDCDLEKVHQLLSRYSAIAVRESDTNQKLIELGLNSNVVADPTLLLTTDDWWKLAQESPAKYTNYVLVYFPTRQLIKNAQQYAKQRGLKVVVINWDFHQFGVINAQPNTPSDWVSLFCHASAVFTNSYHGLLFGMYFCKPLWTANYGNRLTSMLGYVDQLGALIKNDPQLKNKIDYTMCHRKIDALRKESINYLKEALS